MSKPAGAIEVLENCFMYQFPKNLEPAQAKSILDYIERLEHKIGELENQQSSDWISVEDRLPNVYQEVLIYIPKGSQVLVAMYASENKEIEFLGGWALKPGYQRYISLESHAVTHWMPLPDTPELQKEG